MNSKYNTITDEEQIEQHNPVSKHTQANRTEVTEGNK